MGSADDVAGHMSQDADGAAGDVRRTHTRTYGGATVGAVVAVRGVRMSVRQTGTRSAVGPRVTDDSDDELADCNDDYDAWESSGQPAKKRRPNPIALPSSDDYTVVAQILTEVVDKVVEQH